MYPSAVCGGDWRRRVGVWPLASEAPDCSSEHLQLVHAGQVAICVSALHCPMASNLPPALLYSILSA